MCESITKKERDYKELAKEKIDSEYSDAYRNLHLWINVN
jgi:hypothetical protein